MLLYSWFLSIVQTYCPCSIHNYNDNESQPTLNPISLSARRTDLSDPVRPSIDGEEGLEKVGEGDSAVPHKDTAHVHSRGYHEEQHTLSEAEAEGDDVPILLSHLDRFRDSLLTNRKEMKGKHAKYIETGRR